MHLTCEEKENVVKLIREFQRSFVGPKGMGGQTDLVTHKIDTSDSAPIRLPPRRMALQQREIVDAELDKMLENRVIEPSDSPWRAPLCSVTKKDGTPRFCLDFRKLNSVTKKQHFRSQELTIR